MDLLILNGLYPWARPSSLHYRGIERRSPTYCDDVPEEHEINRLFMWLMEEGGESGVVHDLPKALRYADLCNMHFPEQFFEVVEIVPPGAAPVAGRRFLGFDLSGGGHALIFDVLLMGPLQRIPEKPVEVLDDVVRRYFFSRLNQFGLFETVEDASDCGRAMKAVQSFDPRYYAGPLDDLEVTGMYLVTDTM